VGLTPGEVYTVLADAGAELEGKTRTDVGSMPLVATSAAQSGSGACCAS
jgi:hypothetical protein